MKNKFFYLFTTLICLTFAASLIYFFVSLNCDYNNGYISAQKRFDRLSAATSDLLGSTNSPDSYFLEQFNKAVGAPEFYSSVELKQGDTTIYKYPDTIKKNDPKFVFSKSAVISTDYSSPFILSASIYTLSSSTIYSRLKITFIILLASTLLCLTYLIYLYTFKESQNTIKKEHSSDRKADFITDRPTEFSDISYSQNTDKTLDFTKHFETDDFSDSDESENLEIYDIQETDLVLNSKTSSQDSSDMPVEEDLDSKVSDITKQNILSDEPVSKSEEGIFSLQTGVCRESFLNTRLESELVRAASSEQDLCLVLIKVPGLNYSYNYALELSNFIQQVFQFKDMIFEYDKDGFAVIVQNKDIENAMETSEEIYTEICSILNKYQTNAKPFIGISSRSLRLISAERIITEAHQAVLHAMEDAESPIIAFRVNPEKYRKYIAGIED